MKYEYAPCREIYKAAGGVIICDKAINLFVINLQNLILQIDYKSGDAEKGIMQFEDEIELDSENIGAYIGLVRANK